MGEVRTAQTGLVREDTCSVFLHRQQGAGAQ